MMFRAKLPTALLSAMLLASCSDDTSSPDGGVAADDAAAHHADATPFVLPDAGHPDAQPARDATTMDAGPACVMNGALTVDGVSVMVGDTTTRPANPNGGDSILSCRPPRTPIPAKIRFRGCVTVLGGAPTQAELDGLQLDVFLAKDPDTQMPVDPTYDVATRAEHAPATAHLHPTVMFTAASGNCGGGLELVLGRDSIDMDALSPDVEYIIRARSSTTGASAAWVDTYAYGVVVGSDQLDNGRDPANCNSAQDCSGRVDFLFAKRSGLRAMLTASGANVAGAADLDDHVGGGYAIAQAYDCQELPMQNATAGFAPAPAAKAYLRDDFSYDSAATASSKAGALVGVGFTGTSSTTPLSVAVGSAISTDGTCAEAYAGRSLPVHPDALSLIRLNRLSRLR